MGLAWLFVSNTGLAYPYYISMFLRKLDKLVLVPFVGLFVLAFCVAVFIFLTQFFLVWFDELIGKDLGWGAYLQLFFYFGVNATPLAFPLATLVASLMAFGNLGEYAELTALKSAGISLLRVLRPVLAFVVLLSGLVFFSNGYLVPGVNVKAYTLLYDLRKKKPTIAIKEGVFYNGIPDYSIKVDKKLPDQKTLQGIIIYDHSKGQGNVSVTVAESGQLYTIRDDQYMVIELFNGCNYLEVPAKADSTKREPIPSFNRISFQAQKIVFDLEAFKLTRSNKDIFSYHHTTKNAGQLNAEIAKIEAKIRACRQAMVEEAQQRWPMLHNEQGEEGYKDLGTGVLDTTSSVTTKAEQGQLRQVLTAEGDATEDFIAQAITYRDGLSRQVILKALDQAKGFKGRLQSQASKIRTEQVELREYKTEKYRRLASAMGCIIMFLIGAPLGALIKRGGFGVPLLVSTVFILLYYVADMFGLKWAKAGILDNWVGAWAANLLLLPFGLFFLRQAQKDTRLLEWDAYVVLIERIRRYIRGNKID